MDQEQYLGQLGEALNMLSPEEITDIQSYYANSIRGEVLNGVSEQQAIEHLGPVDQVADRILRTRAQPLPDNVVAPNQQPRRKHRGLAIAGIVIAVCIFASGTGTGLSHLGGSSTHAELGRQEFAAPAAEVQTISIDSESDGISFETSPDDDIHIEWNNRRSESHTVQQNADTLELTTESSSGFQFGSLTFGADNTEISIQLPSGYSADSLEIKTTSGDISLCDVAVQGALQLSTASGSIDGYSMSVPGTLNINSASGDIDLSDGTIGELVVGSTSGYVDVDNCAISGAVTAETTSGDIDFDTVSVSSTGNFSSTSGNVELSEFAGKDDLSMNTVSGDIEVGITRGGEGYTARTETVSGDVDVSLDDGAHTMNMSTVSGDIEAYEE